MVNDFRTESFPVSPVPFSVTVALPPLLVIETVPMGAVPVGIIAIGIVNDFRGAILKALPAEKVNSGSVGLEIIPIRLPTLPVFAITSFAVDDAPMPIPTGLKVKDAATLSFDPLGAGVGVGVAVAVGVCVGMGVCVGVAVGVMDGVGVGAGVGVGLPVGLGDGVAVDEAAGPIFVMKPLENP